MKIKKVKKNIIDYSPFIMDIILSVSLGIASLITVIILMRYIQGIWTLTYISNIDLLKFILTSSGWVILLIAFARGFEYWYRNLNNEWSWIWKEIKRRKRLTLSEWVLFTLILIIFVIGFFVVIYFYKFV